MKKRLSIAIILLAVIFTASATLQAAPRQYETAAVTFADSYYRTELYFGRSMPGGGAVSDEEWEKFLANVVTPRFPDGFTILNATGQYRESDGTIAKEPSEVLVFLYPARLRTSSRRKIEEIRWAYVRQFKQESVLRLDFPGTVSVSF